MNASSAVLERREPQAVVDQLAPPLVDAALEPGHVPLDGHALQLLVRGDQRDRARRLVHLAALDADQPVLDHVEPADALRAGPPVQLGDGLERGDRLAVDGDRHARVEGDDDLVRVARRGRVGGVASRGPRSGAFQMSSRKPVSTARPHRFWSIEYGDLRVTSIGRPFSSAYAIALSRVQAKSRAGAIDLQVGRQRAEPDLEPDLVVALAGAAVRDDRAAVLPGRRDQVLDDQRPAQRGHQRVAVHVEGVGAQRRQAEVGGELLARVDHARTPRRRSRARAGG